jgi:phage shock protein A
LALKKLVDLADHTPDTLKNANEALNSAKGAIATVISDSKLYVDQANQAKEEKKKNLGKAGSAIGISRTLNESVISLLN